MNPNCDIYNQTRIKLWRLFRQVYIFVQEQSLQWDLKIGQTALAVMVAQTWRISWTPHHQRPPTETWLEKEQEKGQTSCKLRAHLSTMISKTGWREG